MHGVDRGLFVPVVGRCDEDGVDVFAAEDLAIVAGGEDVGAPQLLGVGEAAVVAVGDGDELDAGDLESGAGVTLALDAGADERELDVVVRRSRRGGCFLREERVEAGCGSGDRRGLESGLEEASAIEHGLGGVSLS